MVDLVLSVLSYLPSYRNVFPPFVASPFKSRRSASRLRYLFGKSSPTAAINPVSAKLLAETAANVAAPPNTFLRVLLGVLMVSKATEPKTVSIWEETSSDV